MTRKSKRELERAVSGLSRGDAGDGDGILIAHEQDDGTYQDSDGDPIPEDAVESAGLVIVL